MQNVNWWHYSLRRYYVDTFFETQVAALPSNLLTADIGGNRIDKRGQFNIEQYTSNITYLNVVPDKHPHLIADAARIPVKSAHFELAICGELLEHVYDPRLVVAEIARILKPQGVLLMTVPFLFPIHGDPDDYGRYTPSFWQTTLKTVGFSDIEIGFHGYFYSVTAEFWRQYVAQLPAHSATQRLWRGLNNRLMLRAIRFAQARDRSASIAQHPLMSRFTTGFGIRCIKT